MSSKPYISGEPMPDFLLCRENEDSSNSGKNPINTSTNQTKDNWGKLRERSKTRWRLSKLEGYVSDEFRSVEFTD